MKRTVVMIVFAGMALFAGNALCADSLEDIIEYDLSKIVDTVKFQTKQAEMYNNYDYYKKWRYNSALEFNSAEGGGNGAWLLSKRSYAAVCVYWSDIVGTTCMVVEVNNTGQMRVVFLADSQFEQGVQKTTITNYPGYVTW
jgi:hypothetical protein